MSSAEYIIKSRKGHIIFDSSGNITEKNKTPRKHKNKRKIIHPELKTLSEYCDEEFWEDFFLGAARGSFKEDIKYSNGKFTVKSRKTTSTYTIDKHNIEESLPGIIAFFNKHDIYSPDDSSTLIDNVNVPRGDSLDPKAQREFLVDQFFEDKPIKNTKDMVKVLGLKPRIEENQRIAIDGVNDDGSLDFSGIKISKNKEASKPPVFDLKKKWASFLKDLSKMKK